jgi:hypothetical protein
VTGLARQTPPGARPRRKKHGKPSRAGPARKTFRVGRSRRRATAALEKWPLPTEPGLSARFGLHFIGLPVSRRSSRLLRFLLSIPLGWLLDSTGKPGSGAKCGCLSFGLYRLQSSWPGASRLRTPNRWSDRFLRTRATTRRPSPRQTLREVSARTLQIAVHRPVCLPAGQSYSAARRRAIACRCRGTIKHSNRARVAIRPGRTSAATSDFQNTRFVAKATRGAAASGRR